MRHVVLALLVVGGGLPLAVHAALGPRYGGELRLGAIGSPSLEPHAPAGATERLLLGMTHETLVQAGPSGPLPRLAESWTIADEGREWTLALAPHLQFHDGAPLTAEDARRAVLRFLRAPSAAASVLADVVEGGPAFRGGTSEELPGLEAADPLSLRLRFRTAVSEWSLLPLASPAAAVVSERGAGCGPFVPTTTSGEDLLFVPFGAHLGGRPYVDRVRVRLVSDARRLMAERGLGRVDVAVGAPAGLAHAPGIVLLVLDPSRPPFDARDRRLAVAAAIDREALAGRMIEGAVPWSRLLLLGAPPAPASEAPAPPSVPIADAATRIVLAVDRALPPLASQRIVAHLAALGLTTSVRAVDASALRQTAAEAHLILFEPEIDEPVLAVHELASLLEPADVPVAALEASAAVREAMALDLEERLRAEATLIPLARLARATETSGRVRGVRAEGHTLRVEDAWTVP
jgi:ABC-type transport system substrate-binding protein